MGSLSTEIQSNSITPRTSISASWKRRLAVFAKPENLFLCFSLVFGIVFVILTPPFQVADEYQHFDRSYAVSKGQFFVISGTIPRSIGDLQKLTSNLPFRDKSKVEIGALLGFLQTPLDPQNEVPKNFLNVGVYSPLPYLPQAVGCLVGRLLRLPPLALFWLARLTNLAFWIFVSYLAIKITPIFKWVLLVLLLLPMSLYQAASASADAFTNALSILTIAICFYFAFGKSNVLSRRDYAVLVGLSAVFAFAKPPYIFLIGLYLLIPLRKFGSLKRFLVFSTVLAFFTIILLLAGNAIGQNRYTNSNFRGSTQLDPAAQMQFILQQPKEYVKLVHKTYVAIFNQMMGEYVGVLGWIETYLPQWTYNSFYPIMLILLLLDYDPNIRVHIFQRLAALLPPPIMLVVIASALFVTWTRPGFEYFEGFQGRYLIPILPPLAVLFYNNWGRWNQAAPLLACIYAPVLLLTAVHTIVLRYYILAI
jgi:uncharacterized membrane protein